MNNKKILVTTGIVLGIIFFIIGIVYVTHSADMLPAFFPGHQAGLATKHYKHGIASFVVGIACFIFAWFQSGPKNQPLV